MSGVLRRGLVLQVQVVRRLKTQTVLGVGHKAGRGGGGLNPQGTLIWDSRGACASVGEAQFRVRLTVDPTLTRSG